VSADTLRADLLALLAEVGDVSAAMGAAVAADPGALGPEQLGALRVAVEEVLGRLRGLQSMLPAGGGADGP
jgi:hypothetical protein